MARSAILSAAVVIVAVAALAPEGRQHPEPVLPPSERIAALLPPVGNDDGLPPLPDRCTRTASYDIETRLDPVGHSIEGRLVLHWTNPSPDAQTRFPFHLYWNAYRNSLSTLARELRIVDHPRLVLNDDDEKCGFIDIRTIRMNGLDLSSTLVYLHPDDDNADDRTLAEVQSQTPVAPGETVRFEIEWSARIPHGSLGRSGWVGDFHFIAQWFPKIAGFAHGRWNRHQAHALGEFFSNFGNYDVSLTLPRGFEVGATGRLDERRDNADGTTTFRFVQEDVHDFAWTASRRFVVRAGRFDAPAYPSVDLRLLVQPEHAHLAPRYLEAARVALRSVGAWSAPYPYRQLTLVDPAWGSMSGAMEYPTLVTVTSPSLAPRGLLEPEAVTLHECAHQFWQGLVATNELEEPWLDEGLTTYHTEKAQHLAYGSEGQGRRYFADRSGWPVVAPGVIWSKGDAGRSDLRDTVPIESMQRHSWEYRSSASFGTNAYFRPALVLLTMERLVGEPVMTRILRTYARRFRFGHPRTIDFIAVVEEVTERSWKGFFEEAFAPDIVDYAVAVRQLPPQPFVGLAEGDTAPEDLPASTRVTILRLGGARLPVDLLVELRDGGRVRETWDGQERSRTFEYASCVVSATVDPDGHLALDVHPGNNRWSADTSAASREARRGASRFLFFLQNLLLTHEILG